MIFSVIHRIPPLMTQYHMIDTSPHPASTNYFDIAVRLTFTMPRAKKKDITTKSAPPATATSSWRTRQQKVVEPRTRTVSTRAVSTPTPNITTADAPIVNIDTALAPPPIVNIDSADSTATAPCTISTREEFAPTPAAAATTTTIAPIPNIDTVTSPPIVNIATAIGGISNFSYSSSDEEDDEKYVTAEDDRKPAAKKTVDYMCDSDNEAPDDEEASEDDKAPDDDDDDEDYCQDNDEDDYENMSELDEEFDDVLNISTGARASTRRRNPDGPLLPHKGMSEDEYKRVAKERKQFLDKVRYEKIKASR